MSSSPSGLGIPIFPRPTPVRMARCRKCETPARLDRMVQGYGEGCARRLGLLGRTTDVGQSGENLLDLLDADRDPEDECDGWDR